MASRLKRLVHRGRDKDEKDGYPITGDGAALPTSAYETSVPGEAPTTGGYPIKGKTSSTFDHGHSPDQHRERSRPRRWSLRGSRRSSRERDATIIPVRDTSNAVTSNGALGASKRSSRNFENEQQARYTSQSRTSIHSHYQPPPPIDPPPLDPRASHARSSSRRSSRNRNGAEEAPIIPKPSFIGKPLPPDPENSTGTYTDSRQAISPHSSIQNTDDFSNFANPPTLRHPQSKPGGQQRVHNPMYRAPNDGQTIVDRAQSNTQDTTVSEYLAPAVTHEILHQAIHHVREEQITREVHEHDVYHRILPVIDVEVLPARHFLPAEGGGLVEVNADDVPGRKNNWVIAETVSQIPSNQPAPTRRRQFSAREFHGSEGASRSYITPEGHKKTEQTWVHPPELETGARNTGQSWPLEIGDLSLYDGVETSRPKTSKPLKHKVKRKAVERGR